ncbi:MAG: glycyl radical protein [Christensenellales bacterium]
MESFFPEPSQRINVLKDLFLDRTPQMCCQRAEVYTRIYKEYEACPAVLKRAVAFRETVRAMDLFIEEGELILGHIASKPRAAEVFPEINFIWIDELDIFATRSSNRLFVPEDVKAKLREIYPYWKGKNPNDVLQALRPESIKKALQCGLISNVHQFSAMSHVALDYSKLLHLGVEGMLDEISGKEASMDITDPDYYERSVFYTACRAILEGFLIYAARFSELAEQEAKKAPNEQRQAELLAISGILKRIPLHKAETFYEAIQAFWLIQVLSQIEANGFSITPGRFDQYMYPYFKKDRADGRLTEPFALELLDCLFLKFAETIRVDEKRMSEETGGYASGQNLVVGGIDVTGQDATNELSYLCLAANYHINLNQPNFTVRLHKRTPDDFLGKVVESISRGNGMPQVLNDEIIIPSLLNKGMPLSLSRDYIPVGCDEITVAGQWGRCNGGYVNFAKVVEITLGSGNDLMKGIPAGLPLDVSQATTFEDFLSIYTKQLQYAIKLCTSDANLTDLAHKGLATQTVVSLFLDGCIDKGRDVTSGGARYNTTGIVGVGTANGADCLYAIREIVYTKKLFTLQQLKAILQSNFEGQEPLRQMLLNKLPKFGNDVEDVDAYAAFITNIFFDELEKLKTFHNGTFWPALYSVTSQVSLGSRTAAGADGRLAGQTLADGLTPMYGQDKSGPTAVLKSLCRVDQMRAPDGVIVNQRLTPSMFATSANREKIKKLLRSFVDMGSFHWQFNVVSNEVLKDAQIHPRDYKSVVVRVAGYSAIFIELSTKAQDSVIARNAVSF